MSKRSNRGTAAGALSLLAIVGATTATGCHEKVDCNKFCDREAECITAISVQLGVATEKRVQSFSEAEVKLLGGKQRERCMTSCNDEKKPKAIDDKWNECLKKSDCTSFAACVYEKK